MEHAERNENVLNRRVRLPLADSQAIGSTVGRIVHGDVIGSGRGGLDLYASEVVEVTRSKALVRGLIGLLTLHHDARRPRWDRDVCGDGSVARQSRAHEHEAWE
ncbi:MAG: hypothetical protein ACXW1D_08265, partial [Halobacteriota archaeon]